MGFIVGFATLVQNYSVSNVRSVWLSQGSRGAPKIGVPVERGALLTCCGRIGDRLFLFVFPVD